MNTWSFKAPWAVLALGLLAGCEDGGGASFLDSLAALSSGPDVALSQARMASGTVNLVPPRGFCIDKRTLNQRFALLARCDTLGVPSMAADAPLGVITVSLAEATPDSTLPSARQTADALGLQQLSDPVEGESSMLVQVRGKAALAGTSDVHWRGTARVGDQLMGLALYGPEDGRAVGPEGRAVLSALIEKTRDEGS